MSKSNFTSMLCLDGKTAKEKLFCNGFQYINLFLSTTTRSFSDGIYRISISSLAVSMIGRMDCLKACYSGTPSDAEKPSPLSSEEREALLRLFLSLNGRSLPSSFNLSIETAIYHDITL